MQDNELLIFLREKQNANKEESFRQGAPRLPLLFVWPKTNKTSPKLRVENLN